MLRRRREYEKVTLSMVWDSDLLEKARSRRDPWHRIHFRTARLDLRRQPVGNEGCPRRLLAQLSGRSDVSGKGEEPVGKSESYEPGTFEGARAWRYRTGRALGSLLQQDRRPLRSSGRRVRHLRGRDGRVEARSSTVASPR